jgi:hypothetical protein
MATLKNVQDSQSPATNQTLNEVLDNGGGGFQSVILPPTQPVEQGYVIFRLVRKNQRRLRIDGICDNCFNKKTGDTERAYLVRGTKSIWQSDLTDLIKDIDKPNSYMSKNRVSLLFEDGICRIPKSEKNQIEYARVNTHNVGKNRGGAGKYDYYEYDANEEQKFRLEKQTNRINMVIKAKEMPEDKMKKIAAFMGISFVDELGYPKGMDGVRSELMIKADTQPDIFGRYIDSKEVEISWMVRKAILDAKIDLTGQAGNAMWANGQGFIGKIPSSRKAYEYLTELAMTNSPEGRQFKEQLETIIT